MRSFLHRASGSARRGLLPALVLAGFLLSGACDTPGGPGPSSAGDDTIDRETFVSAYVDLRLEALSSPDGIAPPERRDEVLRRHGVEPDDLLRFVEKHGDQPDFMREVWAEAQERIERAREEFGDTTPG